MKHALLLVFEYNYVCNKLIGAKKDLQMALDLCKHFQIENITIITDIRDIKIADDIKVKYTQLPDIFFVCREISQFVENTLRGIEDYIFKSTGEVHEVFLYISGHGGEININGKIDQGIILTDNINKRYLISKDLFNLLFGNLIVDINGYIKIPIWKKVISNNKIIASFEYIYCQLTSPSSPKSNKKNRSTYLANRGLPSSTKMLIIIDTCHSGAMTSFPYRYRDEKMIFIPNHNIDLFDDLPFCICLSACFENEKTISNNNGSVFTSSLYKILLKYKEQMTIGQLYFILSKSKYIPILSSTVNNLDMTIPFYTNFYENEIIIINK